jgi:uncharacterized BrkB/YihY/UPF0761 family membrane protein
MIALVFLYMTASIFVYGGELNAVLSKRHKGEAGGAHGKRGH